MEKVIKKLSSWKDEVSDQLKNARTNELIVFKNEIEEAIFLLEALSKNGISKKSIEEIIKLPSFKTGYSEYRIINDCETENRSLWLEIEVNNQRARCDPGDVIIKLKTHD